MMVAMVGWLGGMEFDWNGWKVGDGWVDEGVGCWYVEVCVSECEM